MPVFNLDESKGFEANWEAFLTAMEGVDPEMTAILRANKVKLRAIVLGGVRNPQARADFNNAVLAGLDALLLPERE